MKVLQADLTPWRLPTLVATGSDETGALFAAYTLSSDVLGVDPLAWWVDMPPPYRGPEVPVAADLSIDVPSPLFKFRAIFSNDEDLLGNSRPSPVGESVFDLATWDRLFDTSLRLKLNMYLTGTNPLPDEKSLELAARRGLWITQHHYDLVGSDVDRWPLGTGDWNFTKE